MKNLFIYTGFCIIWLMKICAIIFGVCAVIVGILGAVAGILLMLLN